MAKEITNILLWNLLRCAQGLRHKFYHLLPLFEVFIYVFYVILIRLVFGLFCLYLIHSFRMAFENSKFHWKVKSVDFIEKMFFYAKKNLS